MPAPVLGRAQRRRFRTQNLNVRFARIPPEEWRQLCDLDEAQFEQGIERWTQVLSGALETGVGRLSEAIPRGLLIGTLRDGRQWGDDPMLEYRMPNGQVIPIARVLQFTDDDNMYLDDSPFPDRLMMFDILDLERNIREIVVIRVLVEQLQEQPHPLMERILHEPGPPPPEVMAVQAPRHRQEQAPSIGSSARAPSRLPLPLPNPAFLTPCVTTMRGEGAAIQEERFARKAEVATTENLEELLSTLQEPLSVTHTASQGEVRQRLELWRPAIEKELQALKSSGVLVSHFGQEGRDLMQNPGTTTIPLKGVFTAKAPASDSSAYFRRKCRLVACGNQAPHSDAESLYASGAPAELVRAALVEASSHPWGAYTCDIRSAFTLTPIPKEAGRRYVLKPPRWLVELQLAQADECFTLGRVLYGFREAPVWWSGFRDAVLTGAVFDGCHLVQGEVDPSVWRIIKSSDNQLQGFLITYVDDFLILGSEATARALHKWILEEAKWETDGLMQAKEGSPVRFLGMQLEQCADGGFTIDQEAYIDELIRAHNLPPTARSKVTCPKELLQCSGGESEEGLDGSSGDDEAATKHAQRIAGECLWLSQRTRVDIAFTTSMMCSLVSSDPRRAASIGRRLLMYLAQTKDYKLRLKADPGAPVVKLFTDASFAPEGKHSYGGHIVEFKGSPVVWRAGRQQIISMSSAECELIQVVEGSSYTESFLALLKDLQIVCSEVYVGVDNTAAISLVRGGCSQRTRHLKVRAAKLNQLLNEGWILDHCQGLYQKADILTKLLPSARLKFLCDLLNLGPTECATQPKVQKVQGSGKVFKVCLAGLLTCLQGVVCKGQQEKPAIEVEWPYELLLAMLLIILSTVCLWETVKKGCGARTNTEATTVPKVRAVSAAKERKAKRLQDRVSAAIESAVSETSPSGSEPLRARRGRNKCPPDHAPKGSTSAPPIIQAGVVHVHSPSDPRMNADHVLVEGYREAASSSTAQPIYGLPDPHVPARPPPGAYAIAGQTPPFLSAQVQANVGAALRVPAARFSGTRSNEPDVLAEERRGMASVLEAVGNWDWGLAASGSADVKTSISDPGVDLAVDQTGKPETAIAKCGG
ncbi:unnamed protein product [Symbiodinium sp. CCMP2592]|nr:unnamed protein product [Symbiodinium sp. CCMP2592]